jgi:hypothetical protein
MTANQPLPAEASMDSDHASDTEMSSNIDFEKSIPPQPNEKLHKADSLPGPPPDGGFEAWLSVVGGFCIVFASFGWINCKSITTKLLNFLNADFFRYWCLPRLLSTKSAEIILFRYYSLDSIHRIVHVILLGMFTN